MNTTIDLPKKLWTVAELAAYLKVSEESIRQNARKGQLSGFKIGPGLHADWRFTETAIQEFLVYHPRKKEE